MILGGKGVWATLRFMLVSVVREGWRGGNCFLYFRGKSPESGKVLLFSMPSILNARRM